MGLSIIRNLGDMPIIDIPAYDVVQTTNQPVTAPVTTSQPAPPDIQKSGSIFDILKQGAIATPVDLTKMGAQSAPDTTTPTASPFFKYAAIGLWGLGIVGLIWFLAKRKHSERAVYQNPFKRIESLENRSKTARVNIYSDGKGNIKAKKWFSYKTSFGKNSAGYEVEYKGTDAGAISEEKKWLAKIDSEAGAYQNPKKKDIYAEQLSMIEKSTGLKIQDDDYILTDPIHKTIISISRPEGDQYKKIYPLSNPHFPVSMENPRGQMKMRIAPYLQSQYPEGYDEETGTPKWWAEREEKKKMKELNRIARIMLSAGKDFEKMGYQYKTHFDKEGNIVIDYWTPTHEPVGFETKPVKYREVLGMPAKTKWEKAQELKQLFPEAEISGVPIRLIYDDNKLAAIWDQLQEGETERINKEYRTPPQPQDFSPKKALKQYKKHHRMPQHKYKSMGVTSKLYDRYIEASNNARLAGRISESRRWMKLAIESLPPISNPYNPSEKVFTDFHGFEPTKLKEVSVPDGYPDELVLIGKADQVYYRSNKKNGAPNKDGKEKSYVHDFKKGSLWATDKEGKGLYLIDPKLQVKPEGLVH